MLLAWQVALWHAWLTWGEPAWRMGVASLLAIWATRHGWRLWRSLSLSQSAPPLTLCWTGPLQDEAPTLASAGGWQVAAWQGAVHVRMVWDTQAWMLLHVRSAMPASPGEPLLQHWSWVPSRAGGVGAGPAPESGAEASVHRLRALLCLPATLTTHRVQIASAIQAGPQAPAQPMASSGRPAQHGAHRFFPHTMHNLPSRLTRLAAGSRVAGRRAAAPSSRLESAFLPTEILSDRSEP